MKKYLILNLIGAILILSGITYLWLHQTAVNSKVSVSGKNLTTVDSYKGTIVSFNQSSLVVNLSSGNKIFDISETKDFQGVTYGTLEQGNAVTTQSDRSDLKVGKEVFVVTDKGSNLAKSVYVFR